MKTYAQSLLIGILLLPLSALAHKPSDSYLILNLNTDSANGQWDIALRDLEYAMGIDADGDGAITWGELRARQDAIAGYALSRLEMRVAGRRCTLTPGQQLVDNHSDGAYAVLRFGWSCPISGPVDLDYRLFFDLDPSHRGLLRIVFSDGVRTAVLSPEQSRIELDVSRGSSAWRQFVDYWREGVWHIWIGFDHILFLVALLLPAVVSREGGQWRKAESLKSAVVDVAGIVTAFTVAHSITLSIAVLGWVSLPSRWVESAIAATVVLAALNNLYPLVQGRRWLIAFCLGLIHGFGFASVLTDLGLPGNALALALAGFNLGVETGQLAIVAGFLPAAYILRDSWFYRRGALQLGSLAVVIVAGLWLLERSLNMRLVS